MITIGSPLNNSNSQNGGSELRGDLLAIFGAAFYGIYITLVRKRLDQHSGNETVLLFFALVGILNCICLMPLFPLLHWLQLESFEWPSARVWMYLMVNAVAGTCISEYLWLWSMLLTTPLLATLGLSLTIPLSLLGDILAIEMKLGTLYYIGAFCVLVGFMLVNIADNPSWLFKTGCQSVENSSESENTSILSS